MMSKVDYRQALIDKMQGPIIQAKVTAANVKTAYLTAGECFPVVLLH